MLPALPKAWNTGEVKGLKARGNFEISMEWEDGKLKKAEILSITGGKTKVLCQGKEYEIDLKKGASQVLL